MTEALRILSFYRADTSAHVRRILIFAPGLMTLGGMVIAVSFLTHQPERVRVASAAMGFALVAGTGIMTAVVLQRILRDDGYLAIRTDGIVVQAAAIETLVPWAELAEARWDEAGHALILARAAGQPLVVGWSFARISGPELVARIEQDRRKAAMGLLR
jgi:hypothetical protein